MALRNIPFAAHGLAMALFAFTLFVPGCSKPETPKAKQEVTIASSLPHEQVENIVRRSYQYVAMFNVIQKFALDPASGGMFMDGFNRPVALTVLADHTMKSIARPNNDTLYQGAVLDLRHDAVIIEFPAIDSKYVCLETSGYDHYARSSLCNQRRRFQDADKGVVLYGPHERISREGDRRRRPHRQDRW